MGMFFLFPFGILIPALLIFLLFRFGSRFLSDFFHGPDDRERRGRWIDGGSYSRPQGRFGGWSGSRQQSLEARIFRVAYKRKGRLTISDVVLETGLSIKEAEGTVNAMVDGIRVRMEVDERGLVVYEFPEIMARFEGD
jgi:hypothetical protein